MKKIFITIILFTLFINVGYAASGRAYCPDDDEPVSLRNNPGGTYISGIPCNSEVEVLDINGGSTSNCNTWYKVRYGITTGYACGNYIKLTTSSTQEEGKVLCIEDDSPLGVYSDLNRKNKIAGLSCNTKVTILDKNAGSDGKGTCPTSLYEIKYGDATGYVCGKYIGNVNSSSPSVLVGKSGNGDNIYKKDNYASKKDSDGVINCYENTGNLPLKSSAGGSSTGKSVSCGEGVTINSTTEGNGICPYYYNITDSKGNSGYVCSYYVNTTKLSTLAEEYYKKNSLDDYYDYLGDLGFPSSYLPYLAELHARHPNWVFNVEKINLTFDEVVENENAYGRNLLQGSAFNENYYSMGINNYDILNNKFSYYPTEYGWYDASSEAVAYFLDPRNYLNVKYIFAFEDLGYNSLHTERAIDSILTKKNYWASVYSSYDSNVASDIALATRKIGISSFHIATRIEQEIAGISTSDPRSGGSFTYNGNTYSGYYNFFNIGVYGENKIVNGMVHAMNNGWDTPYGGIYGGSEFIYNGYYAINQDTLYYEKFDVSTSNGNYTHQYMQNLAVLAQETDKAYKAYVNGISDYFDNALEFTIPVYKDMPSYVVTSPRNGNPNNYLSDLRVDGKTVSGFGYDTYDYEVTVPYGTSSVNISADKIVSTSIVSGLGDIDILSDEVKASVIVTAENGNAREYKIVIKRDKATNTDDVPSINSILNNSGIKYNDDYIYGIDENTSVNSLISNIKKTSNYAIVNIKNSKGNSKTNGIFGTGDVITISNGKEEVTMKVVIYGDVNGDGKIDKLDCANILSYYYGYIDLNGAYKVAADTNKSGKIDKLDAASILSHYYKYVMIKQ